MTITTPKTRTIRNQKIYNALLDLYNNTHSGEKALKETIIDRVCVKSKLTYKTKSAIYNVCFSPVNTKHYRWTVDQPSGELIEQIKAEERSIRIKSYLSSNNTGDLIIRVLAKQKDYYTLQDLYKSLNGEYKESTIRSTASLLCSEGYLRKEISHKGYRYTLLDKGIAHAAKRGYAYFTKRLKQGSKNKYSFAKGFTIFLDTQDAYYFLCFRVLKK